MVRWLVAVVGLVALVVGALYYWVYLPQAAALDDARREASVCIQEMAELRGRVADLEAMLLELQLSSAALEGRVAQKEVELATARAAQNELLDELEQEIEDGHVQVERLRGQLKVDLVDEILFDSGEAELNPAGADILKRVGEVLKKVEGRQIVVHGHTDNVQIVGRLAERFPTNWELSAARAVNVTRFLQDAAGIDPTMLTAAGSSEFHPRADNSTPAGRKENRRIEIVLAPAPIPDAGEGEEGGEEIEGDDQAASKEVTPTPEASPTSP